MRTFKPYHFILALLGVVLTACTTEVNRTPLPPLPTTNTEEARLEQIAFLSVQITESDEPEAELLARRGLLYLKNRKENLALDDLLQVISTDSNRGDWHAALAEAYYIRQDTNEAIHYAQKALALNWKTPELHRSLGALYFGTEQDSLAILHYDKLLRFFPETSKAWLETGESFDRQQDTTEAMYRFRQALCYAPDAADSMEVYLKMFDLERSQKQWLKARNLARLARQKTRITADWAYRYAELQATFGKLDSARFYWTLTTVQDSTYWQAHRRLAENYFSNKAYERALPYLEAGLRYRPQDRDLHLWYAHILEYRRRDYEAAKTHYQQADQLGVPVNDYAEQSYRRIIWKIRRDSLCALGQWKETEVKTEEKAETE
ncbi:MAG: tetratricopeptide repeat protein [Bacteroidota bacterium]